MKEQQPQQKLKKNLDIFDLKKRFSQLYKGKDGVIDLVDMPVMSSIYVDGSGDPACEDYQNAVKVLYSTAFTLKFIFKSMDVIFTAPPLQTEWWSDMPDNIFPEDKSLWHWRASIPLPPFILEKHFNSAIEEMKNKGKIQPTYSDIKFTKLEAGKCVQMLRVGAYSEVGESVNKLYNYIEEKGLKVSGKYEEVYISDPRKTLPHRLKTILRIPVTI